MNNVIFGNGNTGKTFIFKKLREQVALGKIKGNFLFIAKEVVNNVKLIKKSMEII